nr:Hpt domain-containing protein [Sulfurimonas sp. MAG313]
MDALLESFLQEARENLSFIDQNIESLGSGDMELVNSVFRAAHTLKGGSGIVGFTAVKDITHHAEDLLDMVRDGEIQADEGVIEALYNAFDEVMNLIEAAEDAENIVESDEETVSEIVETLCACMGKSTEKEAWTSPLNLYDDKEAIVNLNLPFLPELKLPIEFEDITEENFDDERLYALVFDVDASCMVYGNDPAYTLSLLGDSVKYVYSCMSEDSAKSVLSGLDDEEGLELHMQITAFIQSSYSNIEEALFNFMDELLFLPLDIKTLLGVSRGEVHPLDVMKDLATNVKKELANSDKEQIKTLIKDSLSLIGEETLQYAQLSRFIDILQCNDDLAPLASFFDGLSEGTVFTQLEDVSLSEEKEEPVKEEGKATLDENALAGIKMILTQQMQQLEASDDEEVFTRVQVMVAKTAVMFGEDSSSITSKDELLSFMKTLLTPDAETEEAVEEITEDVSSNPELKESVRVQTPAPKAQPEEKSQVSPVLSKAPVKAETKKNVIGKTVKIEQESVDSLMNIIGELLVAKNSLPYLADSVEDMSDEETKRGIMEKYTFINRLSEQLQDLIMSMRMLPISYVFDRYPKLVRDISKKLEKKVKLTMEGGDTKLDKNIIEMMADPMIHIMRNSLDHGIELPSEREAKGKSPEGNVTLKAYSQSDKIIIEIKDDGAGINVDRVIQKVIEKGLMSMEEIDDLDENGRAELVLLAGLSTAEEITEFSGRGVGMDVVKKSIDGFGGSISISTKKR